MSLFLLVLVVALALILIGVIAKGLTVLLVIGIVTALADLVLLGFRGGRQSRRVAR